MKNLVKAIKEWKSVLSKSRVVVDDDILTSEGTATFPTEQKILAILKPKTSREVSTIMKIASRNRVPVYPVSGGKNWGLGSKVPQQNGVVIDLSLMKNISDLNEEMGYVRVEPGVTFGELVDYLDSEKSGLMLDTIGSTPDASIIGNTAERGHGMALYADRFNFVCGLEVVLPNGDVIHTGFEAMKGSALGSLAKWGVGPYTDGLFTQSNFGIITGLTLWLRPKCNQFQSFIFQINTEEQLAEVIDSWRQMTLSGFNASLRIFNDIRMISFAQRFPDNEGKPLSESVRGQIRDKMKIGKWIGLGAVYPVSPLHAEADREFIKSNIGRFVESIAFYDEASVATRYEQSEAPERRYLDFIFRKSLLRGNVSRAGLNMVYWRKPPEVQVGDLHEDGCGVLWYCPAIPFRGEDVMIAVAICEKTCLKYGFEPNIGFLFISQRALDITGAICYDRSIKGEDKKAMACHNELMMLLNAKGYSPYRLGIQSMNMMKFKAKSMLTLQEKLKKAIDPNGILAPGHYELKK